MKNSDINLCFQECVGLKKFFQKKKTETEVMGVCGVGRETLQGFPLIRLRENSFLYCLRASFLYQY